MDDTVSGPGKGAEHRRRRHTRTRRASEADQTASDADEAASTRDQADAERDQLLSDRDQANADREMSGALGREEQEAQEASRTERAAVSSERHATSVDRSRTAAQRTTTSRARIAIAAGRGQRIRDRDAGAGAASSDGSVAERFEELREDAAEDRAQAAHERAGLEAELLAAQLDDLTGAHRRETGYLALSHEIDRARRGDGRFVLAFVDVDDLKVVNDRDGHAAGDQILKTVVMTMREKLRSFDPIVRYGGDEFLAGMGGTDLPEAERRFEAIQTSLKQDAAIGISIGLAALESGETAEELTARADRALSLQKRATRKRTARGRATGPAARPSARG